MDTDSNNHYIAHLTKEQEGLPSENIYRFDGTNLNDSPEINKVIYKHVSKYIEKLMDTSKSSFPLMVRRSATESYYHHI